MKNPTSRPIASLIKSAGLAALLAWGSSAQACTQDPYVGAVCILAVPWTNLEGYAPANGATMSIASNMALYALIGVSFGGDGVSTFMLPDLRGRVVVGAGAGAPGGLPTYKVGDKGGAATVMLTPANVPVAQHSHGATGLTAVVNIANLTATTTMTGLAATTSLAGVSGSVNGSSFTLKAYNANGGSTAPDGAVLAVSNGSSSKIYSSNAPNVPMGAGSIAGTAPVTFSGAPTTTITGNPTTTLGGQALVTMGGMTAPAAVPASAAVNIMPPFLAMNYFIATTGFYPQRN